MNRDNPVERTHQEHHIDPWFPIVELEDGQGTWIGISNKGRVAAILNGSIYEHQKHRSRGHVVPQVLGGASDPIGTINFQDYDPFQLFIFEAGDAHMTAYRWNGEQVETETATGHMLLTSSSYNVAEQRAKRARSELRRATNPAEMLEGLIKYDPRHPLISPCMVGPRSQTIASHVIELTPYQISITEIKGHPYVNGQRKLAKNVLHQTLKGSGFRNVGATPARDSAEAEAAVSK